MDAFQCPTCQKNFFHKGDLTRHKRLHQGLRPHKCSRCYKSFAQRSALQTHNNTHTGAKPYLCGFGGCKSAFGDPSSRSRHVKEVHTPALHICPFENCSFRIKRRPGFERHLRELHGQSPEEIHSICGGSRRRRAMQESSGSFNRTVDKQPPMQGPAPLVGFQESQKQWAETADDLRASCFSNISWTDWQPARMPAFPETSILFAGTEFDQSFVMPSSTFGQLYQIDRPPHSKQSNEECMVPYSFDCSATSASSPSSSASASSAPTPPSYPSPYLPPVIAVNTPQLTWSPTLTYSEPSTFSESTYNHCEYDNAKDLSVPGGLWFNAFSPRTMQDFLTTFQRTN